MLEVDGAGQRLRMPPHCRCLGPAGCGGLAGGGGGGLARVEGEASPLGSRKRESEHGVHEESSVRERESGVREREGEGDISSL